MCLAYARMRAMPFPADPVPTPSNAQMEQMRHALFVPAIVDRAYLQGLPQETLEAMVQVGWVSDQCLSAHPRNYNHRLWSKFEHWTNMWYRWLWLLSPAPGPADVRWESFRETYALMRVLEAEWRVPWEVCACDGHLGGGLRGDIPSPIF